MSIALYHPSSSGKGYACSFNTPADFSCVYATLIRQASWNSDTKNGSFKENKDDPENRVNIKLSFVETSAILDCLERNRNYSSFHDADKPKQIKFEVWKDKTSGEARGYSFGITVTDKQDANYKNSYYFGFNFSEGRFLREFLIFALRKHFKQAQIKQSTWAKVTKDVPKITVEQAGYNAADNIAKNLPPEPVDDLVNL